MYIFHRYYYWLFLFINATIINRKKVDLFLFFQFVKIIKWWHLTLLHIRWTKSHEILTISVLRLYIWSCTFNLRVVWCCGLCTEQLSDVHVLRRVLSIACRFFDELFQKVKHIFYSVSLCLSFCLPLIPAPPKNSGTDESGCVWERRLWAAPFSLLITARFCVNSTCLISVWQRDGLNRGALCCNDHFWMQINVFLRFKLKMCHCFGHVFFYAEPNSCGWMW